jgi:hypothetical protein
MTEDQALKAAAQNREFPETLEIIDRIRNALAAKVFETPVLARDVREELYLRVQSLDAMRTEMQNILTANSSEEAIRAYAEKLAKGAK